MSEFDLNAVADQLSAAVQTESTPTAPASPTPSSVTPETTPVPDKVETASSTPVDDVIEVSLPDGTQETIKRSELPNYILRQKDYTRKTQALAAKAKQYEAFEQNAAYIRQQLEFAQQMQQVTQSPEQLFEYLVEQIGPENAIKAMSGKLQNVKPEYDPNDIPNFQEADKLIENKLTAYERKIQELEQRFQSTLEERIQRERQALMQERQLNEFEAQREQYANKFDRAIAETFSEFPKLRAIDMGEDLIRFKTATKIDNYRKLNDGQDPPFEQAVQWLKDAAKEQVTKLETEFNIQKANSPLNHGIEPPGGTRPVNVNTQPRSHYNPNTGETDWDKLLAETTERIKGLSRL